MHTLAAAWRTVQRHRLLKHLGESPLRAFLAAPRPSMRTCCRDSELVAIDLETTGLNPKHDRILSVGLVIVQGTAIPLETAAHYLVQPKQSIPESSAVIHGITDDTAADGAPLGEVVAQVLALLRGRILLAHNARIELAFLSQACRRLCGGPLLISSVDTQILAQRRLEQRQASLRAGDLRLHALRSRFGLPQYPAHNALSDALAAAELYLALINDGDDPAKRRIADVLTG